MIECVFETRADFEFTRGAAERHPEIVAQLAADYEHHLDPASLRYIVVEERTGGGGAAADDRSRS